MDHFQPNKLWPYISSLIGWSYFLAWSFSFYPQVILNWKRKSVQGLSIDFLYYNVFGFFCYSIFNLSFYFSKHIRDEYKERNNSNENLVRANDVMFAVHAFLISLFTLFQTFIYERDYSQHVSKIAKYFILCAVFGAINLVIYIYTGHAMWIDLMYYLSYIKLIISLIKYIPQVQINFYRKSTVGWSIHNILLDCTGGILSNAQLLLDAYLSGDWSGVAGNPVKLALGLQSIAFDVVFMIQHYILYRDRTDKYLHTVEEERRRLIAEGRVPRAEDEENQFKRWVTTWALTFAFTFPKADYPRRVIHLLQLFFYRARTDWIHKEKFGYWIAEDLKKNAKREAIQDRISEANVIILWVPGGGFRFNLGKLYTSTFATWIRALEADKGIKSMIFVADYKRGPEELFPAAIKDIGDTYHWLVDTLQIDPKKIIIGGDDAGVAIALDTLLNKIDPSKKPAGMICASPYTGLEAGGESWRANLGLDVLNENAITRMENCYLGIENDDDDSIEYEGGLSPFAYLRESVQLGSILPGRMLFYLGGKEVLLEEGGILANRASRSGIQVMVVQEPSGIHLWSMLPDVFIMDEQVRQYVVDRFVEFVEGTIKK